MEELAPGQQEEQQYRSAGADDDQIGQWKQEQLDKYKAAGASDQQIQDYFGQPQHDPSAMIAHVKSNIQAAKAARAPIDTSIKPVPSEDFIDSLAAGWGTGVTSLSQHAPDIAPAEHQSRMMNIGNMIGQMAGDMPAMVPAWGAGAMAGAYVGGTAGSAVGPFGTLGGIALGSAVGGMAAANAAPAGIRKLLMDHYEKGDITDAHDFMNRMSAASWEAIKAGTVGGVTGAAGYGSNLLAAGVGAKPFAATASTFTAELSTMATASAAMEKRLPNFDDFMNAGILMGGLHGAQAMVPKLMGIFKATGERPEEITQAASQDPVLKQDLISENSDLPKIEVPSQDEQEKMGLKPVDENGKIIPDEPKEGEEPEKPTEEQVQQAQTIQVAKEAADEQMPPTPDDDEEAKEKPVPRSAELSDDEKEILNFIGAPDEPPEKQTAGAMIKRDLVNFWRNEDTSQVKASGVRSEFMGKAMDALTNFYINRFDFTKGLGRALKAVLADPKVEDNPEALATLHSGIMDRIQGFFERGTRDFKSQDVNGEAYDKIMSDYDKAFPDDPMKDKLRAFGMAQRVLEKAKQGMKIIVNTGTNPEGEEMSTKLAKRIVDADDRTLEAFNQRRIDFRNRVLQYAHDAGFWTPKQFKAMIDQNESYMSFHRVQELDPMFGKAPSGSKGVFKMKGVGNLIVDPLVSDIKDTAMLIKMAEENKVKQAMVKTLATGDNNAWLRKVDPDLKITKVQSEELSKELDAQGIDHDADTVQGMNVFRNEKARNGPNRMEVHVKGERQVYEGDPQTIDIANRLKGNPPVSGMFSNFLKMAATGIRVGTITPWAFLTKHAFRNQITAGTYSETGLLPGVSPALYAPEFFSGTSERYGNFLNDGGAQSSYVAFDDRYIQSRISKIEIKAPFVNWAFNQIKKAPELSHAMILNNDNLLRFSEYSRTLDQGGSRTEAALAARRVLPDVQTAGLVHSFLLQQTAFLGIHVKSMVRSGEAVADQIEQTRQGLESGNLTDAMKGPLARSIGMITVPAAILAAANYGSQRLDRLEPWQKHGYFNWVHHSWQNATPEEAAGMPHEDLKRQMDDGNWQIDKGTTFRMQMPFTQGIFFGGLVQATLDAWKKQSPGAFADWAKNVAESTVALPIPNFAQPALAQATNYDAFTGRPVIPDNKLQLAPELQYEPYTTDSAKALGKLVGSVPYLGDIGPQHQKLSSPMIVEEYVRDWTGPSGMTALRIADYALQKSGAKKDVPSPQWEWADYPVIGAFCWRNATAKTSDIDDFTDRYEKATSNIKSARELDKEQEHEMASEFRDAHAEEMNAFAGTYKAIHNQKQYIQYVTANPDYSGLEKRQLIDPVFYRMDEMAKEANKQMDAQAEMIKNNKKGQ